MGKNLKDYDENFSPLFEPMGKKKDYQPEADQWKREIKRKYASWEEIRSHKRNWQE